MATKRILSAQRCRHRRETKRRLEAGPPFAPYPCHLKFCCKRSARHSHLNRNFAKSVFCCATFNLGPHTVTKAHTDHLNLPCGWCSITALGDFDEKQGGHLVLWDLRMLIEFPAGSTILIPSAILRHSNTPVQPHERRYSLTQFSPGGVFRWVACGFQSAKDAGVTGRDLNREGRGRWELGLSMFSTWTELVKAHT